MTDKKLFTSSLEVHTAKKIDLDKLRKQHLCIDIQIDPKIKIWLW